MRRIAFLSALLLVMACTSSEAGVPPQTSSGESEMQGVFQYVGGLKGQSILTGGRYVFLYGPADGSGPMTSHAGTYVISGDVATHTVLFHTDPDQVGTVFSWKIESTSGDTVTVVTMDETGQIDGRARSVRVH